MKETDLVIRYPDGRSIAVRIMADGPAEVAEVKEASGPNDSWGAPFTCVNDEKVRKPGGHRAFRTWPEYVYGSPEGTLPKRRPQGRHFAKGRPQFVQGAP
jgi:hypothetical protein